MKRRLGFTMIEVMVATTITMLVLAMVFALIISMLRTWNANSATIELANQSRFLRERLLHGVQGQFGLRHAARGSIVYSTNALQFQDSESSNRFTIALETNKRFRIQDALGSNVFSTPPGVLLEASSVTWVSNILVMDLVLSMDDGRKVWTQSQQIRTYLLND